MLFMLVLLMELYHSSLKVEHGRVIRYKPSVCQATITKLNIYIIDTYSPGLVGAGSVVNWLSWPTNWSVTSTMVEMVNTSRYLPIAVPSLAWPDVRKAIILCTRLLLTCFRPEINLRLQTLNVYIPNSKTTCTRTLHQSKYFSRHAAHLVFSKNTRCHALCIKFTQFEYAFPSIYILPLPKPCNLTCRLLLTCSKNTVPQKKVLQ